jgi:GAF domain-containing protein
MAKIRILNGPLRGREKSLADKPLTIGRDAEAGLQILDRAASRFHCELFPVGGMWFVKDLESKNGTHVNDDRLEDEELMRIGDIIKIGGTEIIYEIGNAISDDDQQNRVSYQDDPEMLSNTLEFRLDDLSDLAEPTETPSNSSSSSLGRESAKGLRILYQVGRILSESGDGSVDKEARVLDCLVASLPAECALIFRRDPSTGKLTPSVVRTATPNLQPIISRSIIKKTFTENKALHSANAQEDDRFTKHQSISLKGIRSVISVPLVVGGKPIGVVYLSRGTTPGQVMAGSPAAFDGVELELVSGVAIQIALAQTAADERRRHRAAIDQLVTAMARTLESRSGSPGLADRSARTAAALGKAMHLEAASIERLRQAAYLHHVNRSTADPRGSNRALVLLDAIEALESVLPLVRMARERVDGSGPLGTTGDELDTESRLLAVAVAFSDRIQAGESPVGAAAGLQDDVSFDRNVTSLLGACVADGSLTDR